MQDQSSLDTVVPGRPAAGGQTIPGSIDGQGSECAGDPGFRPLGPAILYAAKSTKDEHASIPAQLEEGRAEARGDGRTVVDEFEDENKSAYSGNRGKDLVRAMRLAEEQARIHGECALYIQHSDRLARGDGIQAAHLVEYALWAIKSGVRIISKQDPQTFGDLLYAVVTGQRNHEDSRRKGLAVKAGLARRRRKGLYTGRALYGYRYVRDDDEDEERHLVLDPDTAPVVARMYAEYLKGQGDSAIARALNADGITTAGGRRWRACTVRAVLRNPVYAGLIRDGDELIPARHEAIIDRNSWAEAQELRAARARTHKRGRHPVDRHLFRKGFLRCESGGSMMPVTTRKPNGKAYGYYRSCVRSADPGACTMPQIPRARVDDAVYEYFRDLELDTAATRAQLADAIERTVARAKELLASAEHQEREAAARLARVKGDYVAGDLTASEWRELREELEPQAVAALAEVERLREQLAEAEAAVELDDIEAEVLETLAEIRSALAEEVKDADGAAAVRAVLMRLFDGFVLHRGEPDGQGDEPVGDGWWIEPVLGRHTVDRYDAKLRPVLGRSSLGDNCSSPMRT
jgi:DNA invertase Pin-like site-specific DNA recombinase